MPTPFVSPTLDAAAFNCPLCGAYAHHRWNSLVVQSSSYFLAEGWKRSCCEHCKGIMYWYEGVLVVPEVSIAPAVNDDLADDIKADYAEAASIAVKSPRGAAALLRLGLQKLCIQLGESGKDINNDIAQLVKKGLDVRVQRALDTLRVIGNEAVHPGELNLKDDAATVGNLFVLLNAIANDLITQPRLRNELYEILPEGKRAGIEVRDAKAKAISEISTSAEG